MRGYKHLTTDQLDRLPGLYRALLTVEATAQSLGATPAQVRYNLKRLGIPLNHEKPSNRCVQHVETIRAMAAQRCSLSEIGRAVGVKHETVGAFLRRHDIPHTPWDRTISENNPAWRGGRIRDKDGYVLLKQKQHPHCDRHGYVREHRLVMERELGRYLLPTEVVDHIDGDRANNVPSNLRVFASNREHLETTLKERVPNWTPEGVEAMRANGHRVTRRLQRSTRGQLLPDGSQSQ